MTKVDVQTCPVCGVKIEGQDKVVFSTGAAGTRARLWARVCNYVQKNDCINQSPSLIGTVSDIDYYKPI
jgi:hypothetical protein